MNAIRFFWNATRGFHLTPWRSPYIRWRLETYSGRPADTITARFMFQLVWQERQQFLRFLHWIGQMERRTQHEE